MAKRILIAEDELRWQELIRAALETEGLELSFAAHPMDASDLMKESAFDLLILDNTFGDIRNASPDLIRTYPLFQRNKPPMIVYSHDLMFGVQKEVEALGAQFVRKSEHQMPEFRDTVLALLA